MACLTHGKLGGSPAAGELVLETLTCCLGAAEPAQRRHVAGAALVLGALLVSHRRAADGAPPKLGLLLENLQVEASESAAALAQFATDSARRLLPPSKPPVPAASAAGGSASQPADLSVQASNLTLLAVTGEHCSALRLDSVNGDRTAGLLSFVVERAAVSAGRPTAAPPLPCNKGAALPEPALNIARLKLRGRTDGELTVSVRETAAVRWSPTAHRHLKNTADCLRRWAALLKPPSPAATPAAPTPGPRLTVRLRAELTVDAALSDHCRFGLTASELCWIRDGSRACLTAAAPKFLFDGHEIIVLRGLRAERSTAHVAAAARRAACEELLLPQNDCWEVTITSLEGSVPYGYDFSEAWSEELLTTVRWLRRLHGRPSGPAREDGPLPADLCIQIKQLSLEICDDPFEVKLRDNYELLEDEYHESVKRRQTLDLKIEEQRRIHGLLQARKVESLYQQLQQRDAQLFVQRAAQMYRSGAPMRTRLLLWSMDSLEFWALADPSFHGRAACVSELRRIDPLSPWPDDEPAFSTLWCRELVTSCQRWTVTLRDYPQPVLDVHQLHLWGRMVGAEQVAVPRATRQLPVRLQSPFEDDQVDRSLMSLKYYYDLSSDVDQLVAAYGPCWEPAVAMFNLCLEKVLRPSTDPSPPLPWWDKVRLKMHGRITQSVRQLTLLLHASLDPYNTTEEMELTFADLVTDWTDGKIVFKGDLSVYVRTASKYDDCRLLFVPGLKLAFKLDWLCMGDPRDHHAVIPCARDKLPEYSSNQEHDSFRAFRSQNLNMSISIETRPLTAPAAGGPQPVVPTMLLYGSTLRWFENLQFILSGMTRPTRRGAVFNNVRPRKAQLSRHYKCVRLSLNLHAFQVSYWMSFTRQHGLDIRGGRVSLSSEHRLTLRPVCDGLRHRPRACWAIEYLNCELNDAEVWLQSSLRQTEPGAAPAPPPPADAGLVAKWFFLSVVRVSYGRAASVADTTRECPTHRLVVHNMKAAWTKDNRDAGFALFDSFTNNQQLKRNLSTAALKGITFDSGSGGATRTPQKPPRTGSLDGAAAAATGGLNSSLSASTPSPMSRLQSGQAASMLQKLIAELGAAPVAFSEDAAGGELDETALRGVAACHATDVLHNSWLVELVNCQVLLKGIETRGYVIITSSKSQVLQRLHRPVWRDRTLVSKTSWVGRLDGMQYYATVSAGHPASDPATENIMWLTVDNIEERDDDDIRDVPDLVGSGQSVGGVVTETVGAAGADEHDSIQLQRVVSRCRCEFFYASYGEVSVDPDSVESIPPLPTAPSQLWPGQEEPVDALTVTHHDLNVCTNSLQYAMVLDIVNNLLLYVAPRRRQSSDQLQRMRFQMQLSALEDQRRPIQQLQNRCRAMMSEIRQLEKATYQLQRQRDEAPDRAAAVRLQAEMADKERQTLDKKEQLSASAEELAMRIHIYKETQLSKTPKPAARKGDAQQPVSMIRTAEVCIRHAQWRLTEPDGQLGLADLVISNFQYTKHTKSDDSVEHLLELGYISMSNLLPNPAYRDVLQPTETQSGMPVDRQRSLRVYFRERPPVGGISVKEHLEINITPINIGMTYQFFKTMLRFCFPERDTEHLEEDVPAPKEKLSKKEKRKQKKESSFYVAIEKDDVEKMKERAQNNMLFIYIKVPEVTVRVSYKGEKEKNLEDVHNFLLTVPTLEYHNVTWTWLDLLLAMKNDTKRVLLSQAIKQKLQIGGRGAPGAEEPPHDEEDKARLLFGSMMAPGSEKEKPARKSFFHLHRS
ncbi:protein KIAA0100-like [Amphibalanus amphitrite]|uniref:protein KIAA0100-like n=1 Tax=Amphibalanus amphitrite TaxID=1232801 RepID=UPI001C907A8D|nr:protein KIAA0100-like [Amphibalanus amphitrite]